MTFDCCLTLAFPLAVGGLDDYLGKTARKVKMNVEGIDRDS